MAKALIGASRWRTKCGNCAHFKISGKFGSTSCEIFGNKEDSRSCRMWEPDLARMRLPVKKLIGLIRDLSLVDFPKLESYAMGKIWRIPSDQQSCELCFWWKRLFRGTSCEQEGITEDQYCGAWMWDHKQARGHLKTAVKIYDSLMVAEKPAIHILLCREREGRTSKTSFRHGEEVIYEVPNKGIKVRVTVMDFPQSMDDGATPMVRVLTREGKIWTVLSETIRYPRQQR